MESKTNWMEIKLWLHFDTIFVCICNINDNINQYIFPSILIAKLNLILPSDPNWRNSSELK